MDPNAFKIGILIALIVLPLYIVLNYPIADILINSSIFPQDPDDVFSSDGARHIAFDQEGKIVVTGTTSAKEFPKESSSNPKLSNSQEIFLTKLSTSGELVWSIVFGGSKTDEGNGVVVDSENNIIVTGTTRSRDFMILNAFDPTFNEGESNAIDGFIAKFTANGSLLWSTFLGGTNLEHANSVAVDANNNIIVVGSTYSGDFPIKDAYQSTYGGRSNAFISKFTPNGSMTWSTFFGGSTISAGADVDVDRQNNIYITGHQDDRALIAKFTANGSLDWSSSIMSKAMYSVLEQCSVVVDSQGTIFLAGTGQNDVFISKIIEGDVLWSTNLGGQNEDRGYHIAIDRENNVLVTGVTYSPDFPTKNPYDPDYSHSVPKGEVYDNNRGSEEGDAFVSKLSVEGDLLWSTFLGGEKFDEGWGLATDGQNNVYIAGFTRSYAFPTLNAYDSSHNGYSDAFISKFAANGSLVWSTYLGGDIYQSSKNTPFLGWPVGLFTIGLLRAYRKKLRRSNIPQLA